MAGENEDVPKSSSVLGPFRAFLDEYRTLLAAMAGIGATAAVTSTVTALGPPWPSRGGVAALTAITSMVLLAWTFLSARHHPKSWYLRRMKIAVASTAVFAAAYFLLWSSVIYETPKGAVVGGFSLRHDVQLVMDQDGLTADQLLSGAESDPESVWDRGSIARARVAVLAGWVAFFGSVSVVLSMLPLALEAQHAIQGPVGWGSRARSDEREGDGESHPMDTVRP